MIWRTTLLLIASGAFAGAQSPAVQGVFIQQAAEIARRVTDAEQARAEIQRNLGISAEGVALIFGIGQEYSDGAESIEQKLRTLVAGQRLQLARGARTTIPPSQLVAESALRDLDALAAEKLTALKNRLSVEDYVGILTYMRAHPDMSFFPYRATTWRTKASLLQSPVQVWLQTVRGPLSGPDAERLFAQNYRDAELPPPGMSVGYFMGTIVRVEPGRVLLSMENNGQTDVALLLDGRDWKVNKEPAVGTTVRFLGTTVGFTKDPFLVTFSPERLDGIDIVKPSDRE